MRVITFEEAMRTYVNRYTMEHVPEWAQSRPADHGGTETRFYAPHYRTDREWYENTYFKGEHELADEGRCYSTNQSWPLGQWLEQPYRR